MLSSIGIFLFFLVVCADHHSAVLVPKAHRVHHSAVLRSNCNRIPKVELNIVVGKLNESRFADRAFILELNPCLEEGRDDIAISDEILAVCDIPSWQLGVEGIHAMLRGDNVSLKLRRYNEIFTVEISRNKVVRRAKPLPLFDERWADSTRSVDDILRAIHALDPRRGVSSEAIRRAAQRVMADTAVAADR